jgi:hypothetical protein
MRLGVAQDPGMVKCEVNGAHIDPFGAHCVRPHSWLSSFPSSVMNATLTI